MNHSSLPDDFSWRAFDAYYGDDQRPEHEDPEPCEDCGETGPCAPSCHQRTDFAPLAVREPIIAPQVTLMRRMGHVQCDHLVSLAHNCPDCNDAAMEQNIQYWLERSSL